MTCISMHEYLWAENFNFSSADQSGECPVGPVVIPPESKENTTGSAEKIAAWHSR